MDRREFLKRLGVGAIAVQTVDLDTFKAAFTEVNPQVEIVRRGTVVASGTLDQILKDYYLPPVQEMLNSPSIFAAQFNGKYARIPLDFGENAFSKMPKDEHALPQLVHTREYGEARVYVD